MVHLALYSKADETNEKKNIIGDSDEESPRLSSSIIVFDQRH